MRSIGLPELLVVLGVAVVFVVPAIVIGGIVWLVVRQKGPAGAAALAFCTRCGARVDAAARFCGACGVQRLG